MEFFINIIDAIVIVSVVILLIRMWDWLIGKLNVNTDRKYIFVTGCDSGFGEELCVELDRLGCHVFAGCLTVEGMVNIKDKCSGKVFPVKLDVRDHASIVKCLDYIKVNLPNEKGLWGLVNNAGICGAVGPTRWLNVVDFKEVLETNLLGAIDVTLSTLPLLKCESKYESCRIVNMLSVLAHFHSPLTLPYTISKSSLSIFSNVLRMELKNLNVKVCTIEPGAHVSNFTDRTEMSLKQTWKRLPLVDKLLFGKQNYERISKFGKSYLSYFAKKSYKDVTEAYLHALFSRRPRKNYLIGMDALLMKMASYLPESVLTFFYKTSIRITKNEFVDVDEVESNADDDE